MRAFTAHRTLRLSLLLALSGLLLIVAACEDIGDEGGAAGDGSPTPEQSADDRHVPALSSVREVDLDPQPFSVGVNRVDGEDYVLQMTGVEIDGELNEVELRVGQVGDDGVFEEVSTLEAPVPWSNHLMQSGIGPVVSQDDVLFISLVEGEQPSLWIVDLSDPAAPEELTYLETNHSLGPSMAVSDDLLAITGQFDGDVSLFDISDPAATEQVGTLPGSEDTTAMERPELSIEGSHLYMAQGDGLSIIDISDPSQPQVAGFHENPDWDGSEEFRDIERRSPEELTEVVTSPGSYQDVVVAGDYAYVSAGYKEILILDVSDPSSPAEVGRFERDDHTFRLARSDDFLYVLGAEVVDDEEISRRMKLSLETIDISDPADPVLIERITDFAEDFETAAFALLTQYFTHGGDTLIAYGNLPSAYVGEIDWDEPSEETAEATATTASEPDESSTDLPDQDPREVVVEMVTAFEDEDWDRLRELTIDPIPELGDTGVGYVHQLLRIPGRDDVPAFDVVENWEVETYDQWVVAHHVEVPIIRLVLVPSEDGWLYDPGPHRVAMARVQEIVRDPFDTTDEMIDARLGHARTTLNEPDDPDLEFPLSTLVDLTRATMTFDDGTPVVGLRLETMRSERAEFALDDTTWEAGDESGPVELSWTNAALEEAESRAGIPGNPEGGGYAEFEFRLAGAANEAASVELQISDIHVTGVNLDSPPEVRDIDEITITSSVEFALEPVPDFDAIAEEQANLTVTYEKAIEEATLPAREPSHLPFEVADRAGEFQETDPHVGAPMLSLTYYAEGYDPFVEVSAYEGEPYEPNGRDFEELELADGSVARFGETDTLSILEWYDETRGVTWTIESGIEEERLSSEELVEIAESLEPVE